jgi:hypothetical protein
MERIKDTVIALITELEDYKDETIDAKTSTQDEVKELPALEQRDDARTRPTEGQGKPLVCCIAGRTPLDEPPAAMLAQLLRKEGFAAEVAVQDTVSRRGIDRFERNRVATICVCYVDSSGSTSAMRFLVTRLRQRLPDAHLLIAVWLKDHPLLSDKRLKQNVGEAEYVSSLRTAVEYCAAARGVLSDGGPSPQAREVEVVQRLRVPRTQ